MAKISSSPQRPPRCGLHIFLYDRYESVVTGRRPKGESVNCTQW